MEDEHSGGEEDKYGGQKGQINVKIFWSMLWVSIIYSSIRRNQLNLFGEQNQHQQQQQSGIVVQ